MEGQELRDALGKNLKLFRFHRALSQADLAEKAGISITFLSDLERGNKWPYPDTLTGLAKALNIEVFELFRPEGVPDDMKALMARFSEDISRTLNQSLDTVYKQYKVVKKRGG
jgi:transcriptional regulator with XRE-family HTH domain